MKSYRTVLGCVCVVAPRTQGNIDFTPAARTRPLELGNLLPATLASHAAERAQ